MPAAIEARPLSESRSTQPRQHWQPRRCATRAPTCREINTPTAPARRHRPVAGRQDGVHRRAGAQSDRRRAAAVLRGRWPSGRISRAYLEPQPDDAVPRFDYRGASGGARRRLRRAGRRAPRAISQLRADDRVPAGPGSAQADAAGCSAAAGCTSTSSTIPANGCSISACSTSTMRPGRPMRSRPPASRTRGRRRRLARRISPGLDPAGRADESDARDAAPHSSRDYLHDRPRRARAWRRSGRAASCCRAISQGSPLLTFVPLDLPAGADDPPRQPRGDDGAALRELQARGGAAVLHASLRPSRPPDRAGRRARRDRWRRRRGRGSDERADRCRSWPSGPAPNSWRSRIVDAAHRPHRCSPRPRPITCPAASHDRLEAALSTDDRPRAMERAHVCRRRGRGAGAGSAAGDARGRGQAGRRACCRASPACRCAGERIDGVAFDGAREAVMFPGDLPADPAAALANRSRAVTSASSASARPARRRCSPASSLRRGRTSGSTGRSSS